MPIFPKRIFVVLDPNDPRELLAYRTDADAIQDDGPTVVATYVLESSRNLAKQVTVAAKKK